jgi:hypothetical protein
MKGVDDLVDRAPLNCIAFHKGDLVDDWVLAQAVELATNGYITEAGKNLYLIPIQVYEQAKRDAIRRARPEAKKKAPFPLIRKKDCIRLTNFLPKKHKSGKPRLSRNYVSNPLIPVPPAGVNRNACTLDKGVAKGNGMCVICSASLRTMRRGSKYCGRACKQAAYRSRAQA